MDTTQEANPTPPAPSADDKKAAARDAAQKNIADHPLSLEERFVRLENLAKRFFGEDHFAADAPAPVVNVDAEKQAARDAFQRTMQEIEERAASQAREKANAV